MLIVFVVSITNLTGIPAGDLLRKYRMPARRELYTSGSEVRTILRESLAPSAQKALSETQSSYRSGRPSLPTLNQSKIVRSQSVWDPVFWGQLASSCAVGLIRFPHPLCRSCVCHPTKKLCVSDTGIVPAGPCLWYMAAYHFVVRPFVLPPGRPRPARAQLARIPPQRADGPGSGVSAGAEGSLPAAVRCETSATARHCCALPIKQRTDR